MAAVQTVEVSLFQPIPLLLRLQSLKAQSPCLGTKTFGLCILILRRTLVTGPQSQLSFRLGRLVLKGISQTMLFRQWAGQARLRCLFGTSAVE